MPPKKPATPAAAQVDNRTPLEIECDLASENLNVLNEQLQRCKDGMAELTALAARIRSLEIELQPKELEQKNIQSAFSKIVDGAAGLKRPVGLLRTQAAAAAAVQDEAADSTAAAAVAVTAAGTSPPQSQQGSRPGTVPAPMLSGAQPAGAVPTTAAPPTAPVDDSNDKEVMRVLGAASRSLMLSLLQNVFDTPITAAERKAEQEDRADLLTLAAACRRSENARMDVDLTCPIGVEPPVFFDVLKLRAQRILAERAAAEFIVQLNEAKNASQKRKDEGASKVLQKRLEKQIEDARKRLVELQREKDNQEMSRRAAAMLAQQQEPAAPPAPTKQKSSAKVK